MTISSSLIQNKEKLLLSAEIKCFIMVKNTVSPRFYTVII